MKLAAIVLVVSSLIHGKTDQNLISKFEKADTLTIKEGDGGDVDGMFLTLEFLRVHPRKHIVIDGVCNSACTMLLTTNLPEGQVCFTKRAEFGFHTTVSVPAKAAGHGPHVAARMAEDSRVYNDMWLHLYGFALQGWMVANDVFASTDLTMMGAAMMQTMTHKMCA